jgi:flagellin-like protein
MVFNNADSDKRGQVGIGTLIVFIAMVLVAAIAAGVLVNTAGFLQETAEQTGQESQAQVSDRILVVSSYGTSASGSSDVSGLEFVIMKAAGSDRINLESATVNYIGPDGASQDVIELADLTAITMADGEQGILDSSEDRVRYTYTPGTALTAGQEFTIEITTESGATTLVKGTMPSVIEDSDTVVEF